MTGSAISSARPARGLRFFTASGVAVVAAVVLAGALSAAPAVALPEGRTYELVSPAYKGGYGVAKMLAVAPDGESVAFSSLGAFAGSLGEPSLESGYVARRGASGWSTLPAQLPAAVAPDVLFGDYSATLGSVLVGATPGPNQGSGRIEGTENEFLLHAAGSADTPADWEAFGSVGISVNRPVSYLGASADFCHVLFESGTVLLPEGEGTSSSLYELDRGCGGETPLRLVGLNNSGAVLGGAKCSPRLGDNSLNRFNAVALGGREVFFTVEGCAGVEHQLFVRLDGSRTVEVSRPFEAGKAFGGCGSEGEVPCAGAAQRASADFVGANEAGSVVFFTTAQSLVAGDEDGGSDLYMARIGCPGGGECEVAQREVTSLVQVSHDPVAGEAAEVQGVLRVAPDGSRVYFLAHGVLAGASGAGGGAPVKGADNLYVYDSPSGAMAFVADLCSGPGLSGGVLDSRCPATLLGGLGGGNDQHLWLNGSTREAGESQTAGADGGFLLFSSYGQLVAGDTDTAKDVYRYDAQTGALDRVSIGEAGHDANGNNNAFDARIAFGHLGGGVREQYEMDDREISEDGSRVVFTSSEPLSADAVNGLQNAYEWYEAPGSSVGVVSLVSGGSAEEPVKEVTISPSGRDVFFTTSQNLVPQDSDGQNDVYDARLGGGFPSSSTSRQPCSGDACQGPLTNPAALLVPGSVSQAAGGNLPPLAAPAAGVKRKLKAKAKKPKAKKGKGKVKGRRGKAGRARGARRGVTARSVRGGGRG